MTLTVGIDGRVLEQPVTGVPRYIREMCQALDGVMHDAKFVVYAPRPIDPPVHGPRWKVRIDGGRLETRHGGTFLWLKTRAGRLARRDGLDVFWASTSFLPSKVAGMRTVSTVYDLISFVEPATMRLRSRLQHQAFFVRDVRAADAVVAISEGTSQRLERYTGRKADAVARPGASDHFRVPAAAEEERVRRKYGLSGPYVLSVATLDPRKNLPLLIEAFVDLRRSGVLAGHSLALAGGSGWRNGEIRRLIEEGEGGGVRALGYVPDTDLAGLYAASSVFVYPSSYEGYGLPVAEALACGATVLASDIPEIREAGRSDAIYFPVTPAGIRAGLRDVIGSPARRADRVAGPEPATWDAAGRTLAAVLEGRKSPA